MDSVTTASGTITDLLTQSTQRLSSVSGVSISTDAVVIVTLLIIIMAISLSLRRSGTIALIVGLYAAIPLYAYFPYFAQLPLSSATVMQDFYIHAGVYIALAILGFWVARRFVVLEGSYGSGSAIPESALLSVGIVGFLIALSYHLIPIGAFYNFAPTIDKFFASDTLFFWWLLAPLGTILFTTRRFI